MPSPGYMRLIAEAEMTACFSWASVWPWMRSRYEYALVA